MKPTIILGQDATTSGLPLPSAVERLTRTSNKPKKCSVWLYNTPHGHNRLDLSAPRDIHAKPFTTNATTPSKKYIQLNSNFCIQQISFTYIHTHTH